MYVKFVFLATVLLVGLLPIVMQNAVNAVSFGGKSGGFSGGGFSGGKSFGGGFSGSKSFGGFSGGGSISKPSISSPSVSPKPFSSTTTPLGSGIGGSKSTITNTPSSTPNTGGSIFGGLFGGGKSTTPVKTTPNTGGSIGSKGSTSNTYQSSPQYYDRGGSSYGGGGFMSNLGAAITGNIIGNALFGWMFPHDNNPQPAQTQPVVINNATVAKNTTVLENKTK